MNHTTPHHEAGNCVYSPAEITRELAITLDCMLDGYFSCDAQWRFVHINTSAERILGIQREDVIGKNHWEVFPQTLETRLEQEYRRSAAGEVREFEYFCVPRKRWFHNRCFPRQCGGMAVYFRDITERKQSESSAAKMQFLLIEAQKIAHVGSFEYLVETQQTIWSEEEYRIYGLDPAGPSPTYEEMLRQHIHPDDVALLDQTFTTALANGAVVELDHRVVRPGGEIRWVRNRAHPYFNEMGQLSRYIGTTLDITEQRQDQEDLRASEERFRLFMDNSPTITWVKDEHGSYVYLNKTFERCLMVSSADIMGKTDFEVWPEEIASAYHRSDVACLDSGQPVELFEEAVNRRGVRSTWWLHKFIYTDGTGRRYVAGTGVDITKRKAAEERLQQSEERLRLALEASRMGSYHWDIKRGEIFWSSSFYQIFGIPTDSLASYDNWLHMIVPEDRESAEQHLRLAMESKSDFDCEYRICRPDGCIRWIAARGRFSYDMDDSPQSMEGVVVDITKRRNMEEEHVKERNMLQHVMNGAINAHLVYLDRDFNFIRVNEAYAATCGYGPEEMIGKNHFILYPDAENEAIFKRVRDTGEPFIVHDKPFDFPDQAHRGTTYWDWTLNPVKNTSGVVTGLVFSLFETTEKKRAAEEIIRLNTNLEQQVAERTEKLEKTLTALQASEHRYRTVVEDQMEIISRYRPQENTFTFINEMYCRFFGKTQEELLGHSWCPVAVAEDIPRIEASLATLSHDNPVVTIEYRVYDCTGAIRWVQFSNRGIFDEQEQLLEIQSVGRDITERKHLEDQLRMSEEKFRALVETTSECIWETDSRGCFTYLSPKFVDITGYPATEFLGRSVVDLLPADSEYANKESISAIMALPSFSIEVTALHQSGRAYMVEVSGVAVFDTIGEFQGMRGVTRDCTERMQLTESLRDSEERYRAIFNNELTAVFIYDMASDRFVDINQTFVNLYGYNREEVLSRLQLLDLSAESKESVQSLTLMLKNGTIFVPSRYHRKKDGSVFPVEIFAGVAVITGKKMVYALVHDISQHKQIELEREQYFRLFNTSSDLMCIADMRRGYLRRINPAGIEMLGYTEQELFARPLMDFVHPEDLQKTMDEVAVQVRAGSLPHFENRFLRKDGTTCWLSWRGYVDTNRRLVYATARDMTERVESEGRLRQSVAYARNLIEVNLDPLVTIDAVGRISDVNEATIRATGCSREEMIGTDFSSYFTEPAQAESVYQQVFKTGMIQDYPLEIRHLDGRIMPVLYNVSVFRDEEHRVVGVFAAARDITRLKQAEEQLRVLNAELEHKVEERTHELQETQKQVLHAEKLSAIGMLAASIAHEFNNPLQGIIVILKGLRKWAALEEKEKELLDAAIGESERMKNLIRSLQDFNRPSSGMKSLMDVHQALDSVILLQTNIFSKKMIEIERVYAADLPSIEAVPDQIKQVFLNLLTNACDACSIGKNKITISTWREGDRVAVSVVDTGVGITPENLERIFQPFFSTKDTVKGTGLGLSVSHGIIQAHGGEIRVESSPGKGAAFTVILPIHGVK